MKQKKKQKEQVPTILGFNCLKLESLKEKPSIRQLVILREIMKYTKWKNYNKFMTKGKEYTWISYNLLFSNILWTGLSKKSLSRDILALEQMDFIDTYVEKQWSKSRVFIHVTDKSWDLFVK